MGRLVLIPLILLLLLGASALWTSRQAERPADFVYVNRGDPLTLDVTEVSWASDLMLAYALYEGLYTRDPATLKTVPGTASRVEVSPDQCTYTFHIRPDARWSNGDPVVAGDYVFAWRRMLARPGHYGYLFNFIKGAAEYRQALAAGKPADPAAVAIEALGNRTLRVTLTQPVSVFMELCAFPSFFPLHEPSMRPFAEAEAGKYRPDFMRPPNLVSNGPFRLTRWDFKQRLRLEANEHYWDRRNVRSRVIDQVIVEDNKLGEFLRYETGTADWLADLDPETTAELLLRNRRDPLHARHDLHVFGAFGTYFYCFNCQPNLKNGGANPFADRRVRRAFALAVERTPIVQTVTRCGERVAEHYIPSDTFPAYKRPAGQSLNPAEARRLLAEAGFPGGAGFPRVSLLYSTAAQDGDIAQVVVGQWKRVLGVEVELAGVESSEFSHRLHHQEYTISRASWFGDYDDPSTFLDKYRSTADNNDCKWASARYDELCRRAVGETDSQKRLDMLAQAEGILLDEAPIIPLYYYTNRYLVRPNVKGLGMHPRNMVMLKSVYVEK
jgi:oligopeptide transport system substrate-binding protein